LYSFLLFYLGIASLLYIGFLLQILHIVTVPQRRSWPWACTTVGVITRLLVSTISIITVCVTTICTWVLQVICFVCFQFIFYTGIGCFLVPATLIGRTHQLKIFSHQKFFSNLAISVFL